MRDTYDTLAVERLPDGPLLVRLNRPQVANALNTQMGLDLFTALAAQPGLARCVVLTGAGETAFCAGGDLKQRNGMTDAEWLDQHAVFERMARAILDCPTPLIAAVNGAAFGGGTQTLPRAVGERRAKEIILTGQAFSAGEAAGGAW